MSADRCRSCGAAVVFVRTPAGKWAPLDAEPLRLFVLDYPAELDGRPQARMVQAYRPHFSTCPNADEHRAPKPAPEAPTPPDKEPPPNSPADLGYQQALRMPGVS